MRSAPPPGRGRRGRVSPGRAPHRRPRIRCVATAAGCPRRSADTRSRWPPPGRWPGGCGRWWRRGRRTSHHPRLYHRFCYNPRVLLAYPFLLPLEPHIPLKQPFEAATLEPFVTYLEDLAHDVPSFEIVITGIRSFDDGTLLLDVIQDPRLDILRRRILRGLAAQGVRPAPVEDGRYHFHATLAAGLPPEEVGRAQATPE